ncbi:ATP phosphoribosyltransferase regulatory subunit [Iodidimonas muriae]|nr:ATP phosphoribosyltransferase regulatory subunit [Iodidimonas muriae]
MTAPGPFQRALLPEGLRDDLPPWAEHEAHMVDRLMSVAAGRGYRRVAPPLVEFEDSLITASGQGQGQGQGQSQSRSQSMFRLLDPVSQKMMAVRSDMTLQVARIATSRMAGQGRPLRLSYAGHVLRVRGTQLRPARQFRQAGVELIGSDALEADLEVIALAAEALTDLGIKGLSVDLVSPTLVPSLARQLALDLSTTEAARRALDAKDIAALAGFDKTVRDILTGLMQAAGSLDSALPKLERVSLDGQAARIRDTLVTLARALKERVPDLKITIDPGECRGFEFHTGVGFAFFAPHVSGELGRGGRYQVACPDGGQESAVGFSMYLDSLLRAVPVPVEHPRIYLPFGTGQEEARRLRSIGWRTVYGLVSVSDPAAAARAEGCTHLYEHGVALSLTADDEASEE